MFLKKRSFLFGAKQRGSVILGVMGVMGVTTIVAITATTVSLHAVGITTSTRAGVQAEAAAEAGVDFAAANLATAVCQSLYTNTTAPIFSVTVSYSTLSASPGNVDTSWVSGCPTTANAARLRLVSTGTASSVGVAGNSSDDVRRVEAIYAYTPAPPITTIIPSGAALYSFAQTDPTVNNLTVTQASTTRPTIQYLSGSVTCTSGTTIQGDVVLGAGTLSVTSGCTIDGDLWASSGISIVSGEVTGNVDSEGEHDGHNDGSVSISSSAKVDGDVHTSGDVNIDGKVGGNVVIGSSGSNSSFSNHSSVGGSVVSAGSITAASGVIKGTISTNQNGVTIPPVPIVPGWVDYAYSPSDWVTSTGAPYAVITLKSCTSNALATGINNAAISSTPVILDTRVCGSVTDFSGYNFALTSDTVIIANGFKFSSNNIQSSNSTDKRLWIIIPDTVADQAPTCPIGSSASIGNQVVVGPHVGAMIYSPCPISNGGDVWRGQMYSSSIGTSSSFTLNFLPIGLPTVNLSTGQFLAPSGTGVLGNRVSIRDLTVA